MKDKGLLLCNYADGLDPLQVQKLNDRLNDYYGDKWNVLMAPSLEKKTDVEFVLCEDTTIMAGPAFDLGAVEFKADNPPTRIRSQRPSANGQPKRKRSYVRHPKKDPQ